MQKIIQYIKIWKKGIIISVLLFISFLSGTVSVFSKPQVIQPKVLGISIHVTPTPTITPLPTVVPITIVNNIILPTSAPEEITPTLSLNPTPTLIPSTPTPTLIPTAQPTQASTATPTIEPTNTPTPVNQTLTLSISYAGEHANNTYTIAITPGETAWQAVQEAVGLENIQYTDYGGTLGIFITGFNGVNATSNQYYNFKVNGTDSSIGVSSYIVNNQDVLSFVLTNY